MPLLFNQLQLEKKSINKLTADAKGLLDQDLPGAQFQVISIE
jgi:hypothetical protein